MRRLSLAFVIVVLSVGLGAAAWWTRSAPTPLSIAVVPSEIPADGHAKAVVTIHASSKPRLTTSGRAIRVGAVNRNPDGFWHAELRAGGEPGSTVLRAEVAGVGSQETSITLQPFTVDRQPNGLPDAVELDSADDQRAFRAWFTFLAEVQYFQNGRLPAEITDCGALLRYAFREALRPHDEAWAKAENMPVALALPAVEKYHYPHTLLGASLFRVKGGPFAPEDLAHGAFAQFADAEHLHRWNTHFVTRDLDRAEPGDLLFFRHDEADLPFHAMIYLGRSQIDRDDPHRYLIYHTGPDGENPGEIRRPSVEQLWQHPNPQWRPLPGNPTFLGVFRWNILP